MLYQFHYPDKNITQTKILIAHEDYLIVKAMPESTDEEISAKEKALHTLTKGYQFFTDQSPLFAATFSGILHCNGTHTCIAKKIELITMINSIPIADIKSLDIAVGGKTDAQSSNHRYWIIIDLINGNSYITGDTITFTSDHITGNFEEFIISNTHP